MPYNTDNIKKTLTTIINDETINKHNPLHTPLHLIAENNRKALKELINQGQNISENDNGAVQNHYEQQVNQVFLNQEHDIPENDNDAAQNHYNELLEKLNQSRNSNKKLINQMLLTEGVIRRGGGGRSL